MPELPEVEVTRRGIAPYVAGRVIERAVARDRRLRWPVPACFEALAGHAVRTVRRRGKYLLFECDGGHLIVHLGMSGSLRLLPADAPPGKHDHVDLVFGDRVLRLRDPRRFGAVLWTESPPEMHPLLVHLGIEPLSRALSATRLYDLSRGHRAAIKHLLMDGRRIVGIGNIYACESLFLARIDPRTPAGRLSRERCERLVVAIKQTLRKAIRAGGSSLRDFVRSDGEPGHFQLRSWVYGRAGLPCRRCGATLRRIVQGQRATFYCPRCQR
jgi:formamidopyrimidine-DNA glycosylase